MAGFDIGLGIDSFIACLAMGALPITRWEAVRLAAAFGLCDAAATLIGMQIPHAMPTFAGLGIVSDLRSADRDRGTSQPANPLPGSHPAEPR